MLPSAQVSVAQWIARRTSNPEVVGSSPTGDAFSTSNTPDISSDTSQRQIQTQLVLQILLQNDAKLQILIQPFNANSGLTLVQYFHNDSNYLNRPAHVLVRHLLCYLN